MAEDIRWPLLEHEPSEAPVFRAANLLEAARARKGLPRGKVPAGCLLDFDGELADHLVASGKSREDSAWPCFHTRLYRWRVGDQEYGAIGDVAHPSWRASAVGVYRLWRDAGYAFGALLSGIIADLLGVAWAIAAVGVLTLASGLIVALRMNETLKRR